MIGMLTMTANTALLAKPGEVFKAQDTSKQVAAARDKEILNPQHVATLGAQLFSTHLIAVEVAGTLLLVALVGAIAIVGQHKRPEPGGASLAGGPTHG
jgi:NADH:ubiquinone oxidoreductase subunit 6 (subunit J)